MRSGVRVFCTAVKRSVTWRVPYENGRGHSGEGDLMTRWVAIFEDNTKPDVSWIREQLADAHFAYLAALRMG